MCLLLNESYHVSRIIMLSRNLSTKAPIAVRKQLMSNNVTNNQLSWIISQKRTENKERFGRVTTQSTVLEANGVGLVKSSENPLSALIRNEKGGHEKNKNSSK